MSADDVLVPDLGSFLSDSSVFFTDTGRSMFNDSLFDAAIDSSPAGVSTRVPTYEDEDEDEDEASQQLLRESLNAGMEHSHVLKTGRNTNPAAGRQEPSSSLQTAKSSGDKSGKLNRVFKDVYTTDRSFRSNEGIATQIPTKEKMNLQRQLRGERAHHKDVFEIERDDSEHDSRGASESLSASPDQPLAVRENLKPGRPTKGVGTKLQQPAAPQNVQEPNKNRVGRPMKYKVPETQHISTPKESRPTRMTETLHTEELNGEDEEMDGSTSQKSPRLKRKYQPGETLVGSPPKKIKRAETVGETAVAEVEQRAADRNAALKEKKLKEQEAAKARVQDGRGEVAMTETRRVITRQQSAAVRDEYEPNVGPDVEDVEDGSEAGSEERDEESNEEEQEEQVEEQQGSEYEQESEEDESEDEGELESEDEDLPLTDEDRDRFYGQYPAIRDLTRYINQSKIGSIMPDTAQMEQLRVSEIRLGHLFDTLMDGGLTREATLKVEKLLDEVRTLVTELDSHKNDGNTPLVDEIYVVGLPYLASIFVRACFLHERAASPGLHRLVNLASAITSFQALLRTWRTEPTSGLTKPALEGIIRPLKAIQGAFNKKCRALRDEERRRAEMQQQQEECRRRELHEKAHKQQCAAKSAQISRINSLYISRMQLEPFWNQVHLGVPRSVEELDSPRPQWSDAQQKDLLRAVKKYQGREDLFPCVFRELCRPGGKKWVKQVGFEQVKDGPLREFTVLDILGETARLQTNIVKMNKMDPSSWEVPPYFQYELPDLDLIDVIRARCK